MATPNPNDPLSENYPAYRSAAAKGLTYIDPNGDVWRSSDVPVAPSVEGEASETTTRGGLRYQVIPIERKRRVKAFDFISKKGTFMQDNKMESNTLSLSVYFIGNDHHEKATAFEAALSSDGYGILSLPLDDTEGGSEQPIRNVLPTSYKRTNRFVEAANRTTFEIQFRETIIPPGVLVLGITTDAGKVLLAAQSAFEDDLAADLSNPTSVKDKMYGYVKSANDFLRKGVDGVNSVKNEFDTVTTALDTNIANLFEKPAIIAGQVQRMLNTPIFPRLTDLTSSYKGIIDSVTDQPSQLFGGAKNLLQVQTLFGAGAITVLMNKTLDFPFGDRQTAVDAFEKVKAYYEDFLNYLVDQEERTAGLALKERFVVDPSTYESLYQFLQAATGRVDSILIGLRQQVTLVTDQDTTPLNLAAKHYPELFVSDSNAAMALFEQTNELDADRVILIGRGEEYKVLI